LSSGWRWNTSKAFLRPIRRRLNLTVITGAHVQRILFEKSRCVGVEFIDSSGSHSAHARAEVLLTAGAINSPQLLELSGVGDGARLQRLGIPVVYDAPGVGSNLQDHLQLRISFRVTGVATLNTLSAHWWRSASIRRRRAPRNRRLGDADDHVGQYELSHINDRRTCCRPHSRLSAQKRLLRNSG
jgi:choline dehydrogenase